MLLRRSRPAVKCTWEQPNSIIITSDGHAKSAHLSLIDVPARASERGNMKEFQKGAHEKKKITQEEIHAERNANWFSDPCAKREPSHWTYCQSDLTVKNVLPPTLLTLHIPHAPVLFSFLSLSHSCRVPWISALKFCSPILNRWMHQSWFGILNRVLHIASSVNKKEGGSTSSKGFSWVWNNVCCKRDYCRCGRSSTRVSHMSARTESATETNVFLLSTWLALPRATRSTLRSTLEELRFSTLPGEMDTWH